MTFDFLIKPHSRPGLPESPKPHRPDRNGTYHRTTSHGMVADQEHRIGDQGEHYLPLSQAAVTDVTVTRSELVHSDLLNAALPANLKIFNLCAGAPSRPDRLSFRRDESSCLLPRFGPTHAELRQARLSAWPHTDGQNHKPARLCLWPVRAGVGTHLKLEYCVELGLSSPDGWLPRDDLNQGLFQQ